MQLTDFVENLISIGFHKVKGQVKCNKKLKIKN